MDGVGVQRGKDAISEEKAVAPDERFSRRPRGYPRGTCHVSVHVSTRFTRSANALVCISTALRLASTRELDRFTLVIFHPYQSTREDAQVAVCEA